MPSFHDDEWAIMTIVGEAASEPFEGQLAVANVIRERMKRKYNSDGTIVGTVLARRQFSMWDDHARLYVARLEPDDKSWAIAVNAWADSRVRVIVPDAVLYHTVQLSPKPRWADAPGVEVVDTIKNHIFYSDSGRGI